MLTTVLFGSVDGHRVICTDEDEELRDVHGPQGWYGIDADPGGFSEDDVARSHERVRLQVFFLVDL